MNIYNGIKYINDLFYSFYYANTKKRSLEEDILLLSMMCFDVRFLKARNGKYYFYYCSLYDEKIKFAKCLMNRNGLNAKIHKSYYYNFHPVLRIPYSNIKNKPEHKNFIKSINVMNGVDINELNNRLYKMFGEFAKKTK